MSFLWIISGSIGVIMGSLIPDSDSGIYWGTPFIGVGIFAIIMDMRKHKKEQQNNTSSL